MDYELTIANNVVVPNPAGLRLSLISLSRSYDEPSELEFQVDGDWRPSGFAADSEVVLRRGSTVIFRGLLDLPEPHLTVGHGAFVVYRAFDHSRLARQPGSARALNGITSLLLEAGTVQSVVGQFLAAVAWRMGQLGIGTTVEFAGNAGAAPCLAVRLENASIDDGIRKIAASAPGIRVWMSPGTGTPTYRFVNLFGSPSEDLVIDETRLSELSVSQSLEGRAGAVRTTSRGSAGGDVERVSGAMAPAWDTALEAEWTIDRAFAKDDPPTAAETNWSKVHRWWSFSGFSGDVDRQSEVEAVLYHPYRNEWARVGIDDVDWDAKIVKLKEPALKPPHPQRNNRPNPAVPGKAQRGTVRLVYGKVSDGSGLPPGYRIPATGFGGRAYALAPRSMGYELQLDVPEGVNPILYAQWAFYAHSEPLVTGNIPYIGEPSELLFFLDRRLNVRTASHGLTGYEHLNAPIAGFTHDFADGGRGDIEFSTDRMALLQGGA